MIDMTEERCWKYLLANRQATAEEVALNCDVTWGEAEVLIARISSPNWREPVTDQQVGDNHYASLQAVLVAAFDQSAHGKGRVRHANDKPFLHQPIMEIGRMVGLGYPIGQAMKKAQEATGMARRGEIPAAQAELLGAIVYLSAAHILLAEMVDDRPTQTD